jgi:hypothetical protein
MSSTGRGAIRVGNDYYRTPAWAVEAILPHLDPPLCVLDPGCGDGAIGAIVGPHFGVLTIGIEIDERMAERARRSRDNATGLRHYDTVHCADYLGGSEGRLPESGQLIIGNPPFKHAMAFVARSLELAGPLGTVCMLLRLPWMASKGRQAHHRRHPSDVFVLPVRPSFCWTHTYLMRCGACRDVVRFVETVACGVKADHVRAHSWLAGGGAVARCPCPTPLTHHKTTTSTADSCDYAWFVHGPSATRRWTVLAGPKE